MVRGGQLSETVPGLAELLAPLGLDAFVRDHFEGTPVHARGAPERVRGLFGSADLFQLVRSRPLATLSASPPDPEGRVFRALGRRPTMPLDPRGVDVALATGSTLMLDHLQRLDARIAALAARFKRDLALPGRVSVVAFYSPPHAGVPTHMDGGSTFIVHLEGKKTWRLSAHPRARWPRVLARQLPGGEVVLEESDGAAPDLEPWEIDLAPLDPADTMEVVLEPGDLLYVPPGAWHGTVADDEPTLSVNVHFEPLDPVEVFAVAVKPLLGDSSDWRRVPVLGRPLGEGMPSGIAAWFRERIDELRIALGRVPDATIERAYKRLVAEIDDGPRAARDELRIGDRVRLASTFPVTFMKQRDGDRVVSVSFFRGDREIVFDDPALVPLACAVVDRASVVIEDRLEVYETLLHEGILERAVISA